VRGRSQAARKGWRSGRNEEQRRAERSCKESNWGCRGKQADKRGEEGLGAPTTTPPVFVPMVKELLGV